MEKSEESEKNQMQRRHMLPKVKTHQTRHAQIMSWTDSPLQSDGRPPPPTPTPPKSKTQLISHSVTHLSIHHFTRAFWSIHPQRTHCYHIIPRYYKFSSASVLENFKTKK